jgi:hypothetical protein
VQGVEAKNLVTLVCPWLPQFYEALRTLSLFTFALFVCAVIETAHAEGKWIIRFDNCLPPVEQETTSRYMMGSIGKNIVVADNTLYNDERISCAHLFNGPRTNSGSVEESRRKFRFWPDHHVIEIRYKITNRNTSRTNEIDIWSIFKVFGVCY